MDTNDEYKRNQFQIYNLQETILNSTKSAKHQLSSNSTNKENVLLDEIDEQNDDIVVDSTSVLKFVAEKYPRQENVICSMYYHPFRTGVLNEKRYFDNQLLFPYNIDQLGTPAPFLPPLGDAKINSLITIHILYEDLTNKFNMNPRLDNNELWGCQIYTDDSDPILVLKHSGVLRDTTKTTDSHRDPALLNRTPGNLRNTDDVTDSHSLLNNKDDIPYDIEMTILILPCLRVYSSVKRFGLTSRQWGEDLSSLSNTSEYENEGSPSLPELEYSTAAQQPLSMTATHDGLSYSIYSIKVVPRKTNEETTKSATINEKELPIVSKIGSNWFNQN
ncbi:hypothetical protein TPHA_0B02110 [Tetrapisispora phaffii CBS 4417]|uniref:Uncharacterized protein n=1 Tax=Tetrapisispora phaffii (strain ATCC 24235 / CBS 4417 / NBRC 1672 / NRRL Y-8282 / UCD 70-5) TaxID=1071381 RepID=G8BPF2_TETPH|nr:hypothetical protein TPHA_0B02110 [Tetrapisispora phaffii CBS 4417]CCE61883.1 hypothetical protein TPHA_0B02110 [Tetrapisispora phaffii CBS 4417]